jgi:hypothetical protein
MIFGDGTRSKKRPQHDILDFYIKVQVWGRIVRVSPQVPDTPKTIMYERKKREQKKEKI